MQNPTVQIRRPSPVSPRPRPRQNVHLDLLPQHLLHGPIPNRIADHAPHLRLLDDLLLFRLSVYLLPNHTSSRALLRQPLRRCPAHVVCVVCQRFHHRYFDPHAAAADRDKVTPATAAEDCCGGHFPAGSDVSVFPGVCLERVTDWLCFRVCAISLTRMVMVFTVGAEFLQHYNDETCKRKSNTTVTCLVQYTTDSVGRLHISRLFLDDHRDGPERGQRLLTDSPSSPDALFHRLVREQAFASKFSVWVGRTVRP
jgi:hypothetical protein